MVAYRNSTIIFTPLAPIKFMGRLAWPPTTGFKARAGVSTKEGRRKRRSTPTSGCFWHFSFNEWLKTMHHIRHGVESCYRGVICCGRRPNLDWAGGYDEMESANQEMSCWSDGVAVQSQSNQSKINVIVSPLVSPLIPLCFSYDMYRTSYDSYLAERRSFSNKNHLSTAIQFSVWWASELRSVIGIQNETSTRSLLQF